jgi:hypothetical protein
MGVATVLFFTLRFMAWSADVVPTDFFSLLLIF